jgi:hypothetical protein
MEACQSIVLETERRHWSALVSDLMGVGAEVEAAALELEGLVGAEGIAAPFHNVAASIDECLEQGLGPMGGGWTAALLRVFEVSAGAIRCCGMTLFPQAQATGISAPFIDVALAARIAADKDHYRTWKDAWDDRAWSLLDRFATETLAAASGRTADAVRKSRSRRGIE